MSQLKLGDHVFIYHFIFDKDTEIELTHISVTNDIETPPLYGKMKET